MGSDNLYLAVLDVLFKLKHDSRILLVEHPSHDHHNLILCAALPPIRGTCSCRVLRKVAGDLYEASKYWSVFSHFSISGKYHSLQVEILDTDDR
jgi:hypothetical protein